MSFSIFTVLSPFFNPFDVVDSFFFIALFASFSFAFWLRLLSLRFASTGVLFSTIPIPFVLLAFDSFESFKVGSVEAPEMTGLSAFDLCLLHFWVLVYIIKCCKRVVYVHAILASHKTLEQSIRAGSWRNSPALQVLHIERVSGSLSSWWKASV